MLWNPQNDFYTLYGLRDWLATRPADEEYVFYDCYKCVVGKYLEAHSQHDTNYATWIERTPDAENAVHQSFNAWPTPIRAYGHTLTMGEALKRLDAYMAKQVVQAA